MTSIFGSLKFKTVILVFITSCTCAKIFGADSAKFLQARDLYNKKNFAAAAAAFESIIQTTTPQPRLYYYAGLAYLQSGKQLQANQLFKYIDSNFPNTTEGRYAHQILQSKQNASTSNIATENNNELPQSLKNTLPDDVQALLQTEEGKQMTQQIMREQKAKIQAIRNAEREGRLNNQPSPANLTTFAVANKSYEEHPFKPADIAREGAAGIDQGRNPNCWFEASISALAQLSRGQRLLSDTIRLRQGDKYIIRFHNDGVEYTVTRQDLIRNGIHDKALWASLIECAELKKFPGNAGANGIDNDQSRLEIGLASITGCRAEVINPQNCDLQELSSFIGSAIKSQNPIVAATYGDNRLFNLPEILVSSHAYTVINFDPASNIVTIRNPHGRKSKRFHAPKNDYAIQFEQFDDGVIKLGLTTFQKYFHAIARSFI
jgi:hypothetical protein